MLGIDLGTTNSCVSIYTEEEMRVLHLEANKDTLPSVVRFVDRKLDNVVVGTPAKRMMIIKPNEVFASVKSLMRDDKWKEDKTVVDKFTIDGQELTPTDVSSIILKNKSKSCAPTYSCLNPPIFLKILALIISK